MSNNLLTYLLKLSVYSFATHHCSACVAYIGVFIAQQGNTATKPTHSKTTIRTYYTAQQRRPTHAPTDTWYYSSRYMQHRQQRTAPHSVIRFPDKRTKYENDSHTVHTYIHDASERMLCPCR